MSLNCHGMRAAVPLTKGSIVTEIVDGTAWFVVGVCVAALTKPASPDDHVPWFGLIDANLVTIDPPSRR